MALAENGRARRQPSAFCSSDELLLDPGLRRAAPVQHDGIALRELAAIVLLPACCGRRACCPAA